MDAIAGLRVRAVALPRVMTAAVSVAMADAAFAVAAVWNWHAFSTAPNDEFEQPADSLRPSPVWR